MRVLMMRTAYAHTRFGCRSNDLSMMLRERWQWHAAFVKVCLLLTVKASVITYTLSCSPVSFVQSPNVWMNSELRL